MLQAAVGAWPYSALFWLRLACQSVPQGGRKAVICIHYRDEELCLERALVNRNGTGNASSPPPPPGLACQASTRQTDCRAQIEACAHWTGKRHALPRLNMGKLMPGTCRDASMFLTRVTRLARQPRHGRLHPLPSTAIHHRHVDVLASQKKKETTVSVGGGGGAS